LLRDSVDQGALVAQIYEAATEPELWTPFMNTVARVTEARTGVIYSSDLRHGTARMICAHRLDMSRQPDYEKYYNSIDAFQPRALRLPVGRMWSTHKIITDSELERTEFYSDFLRHMSIFYAAGGVILHDKGTVAIFGLQRSRRDGPFNEETEAWLDNFSPHLRRSIEIGRRIEGARRLGASILDGFANWADAVVIADSEGRILFANPVAEQLLSDFGLARKGRLSVAARAGAQPLSELIAAAVRCAEGSPTADAPGNCLLAAGGKLLAVSVLPFRMPAPEPGMTRAVALLTIRPRNNDRGLRALARRHRLTGAEDRLWRELLAGKALKTIAGETGVSVETLRIHLKHLFHKMGVHRQSELIRIGLLSGGESG
jgi:DNA-binding CsgD family transcriptional regulator/PAS domain-containing protein